MKEMIKGQNLQRKVLSYSHPKIQSGPCPTPQKTPKSQASSTVWLLNSTGIAPLNIAYV